MNDLFDSIPAFPAPSDAGPGAAAVPSPAAAPSLAPWWAWLREIVGRHHDTDAQVEAMCRKAHAGWDGLVVDGQRLPGFSDGDKAYWRAHFRAAAEAMIDDEDMLL